MCWTQGCLLSLILGAWRTVYLRISSLLFASPVGLLASTSHDLQLACVLQLNLKGLGHTFAPPSLKPWLLVGKGMDQE